MEGADHRWYRWARCRGRKCDLSRDETLLDMPGRKKEDVGNVGMLFVQFPLTRATLADPWLHVLRKDDHMMPSRRVDRSIITP
jgi:hypothetical protein